MKAPSVKYKTHIKQLKFQDKLVILETIRDLDEAIDQICEAMTPEEQLDPFAEDLCPYFGVLWPAAEALSIYLSENPHLIQRKQVLELGCGLGLPSIVATQLGAQVLASDFHPDVEEYFLRNCRHTNITCSYQRLNWREENAKLGRFDVVIGSDVLYESKHPKEVAQGLLRYVKPQGKVLLSDPGRNHLQHFMNAMNELGHQENLSTVAVEGKENFILLYELS